MEEINIESIFELIKQNLFFYIPKLALGGIVLWLGMKLVEKAIQLIAKFLEKTGVDDTVRPFLVSMVGFVSRGLLLFIVASILGVNLSSLVAILAAIGFAVGMALQGSLGNFASGILILTLRPYKASDWIQVEDYFGKVVEIGIFSTLITSPGGKALTIPNSKITDEVVVNFSRSKRVRLELQITMPYSESFPKVKQIIEEALKEVPEVLQETEVLIGIENFDSHSIQISIRPYVNPEDYWKGTFAVNKAMKAAFHANEVSVAYSEGVEMGSIGK